MTNDKRRTLCPHFNTCSRNLCPLDEDIKLRVGGKQDKCRWILQPQIKKIGNREFISGGRVMPDTPLTFVPEKNIKYLNTNSQKRLKQLKKEYEEK